jgi:hypothetical protein
MTANEDPKLDRYRADRCGDQCELPSSDLIATTRQPTRATGSRQSMKAPTITQGGRRRINRRRETLTPWRNTSGVER